MKTDMYFEHILRKHECLEMEIIHDSSRLEHVACQRRDGQVTSPGLKSWSGEATEEGQWKKTIKCNETYT